MPRRRSNVASAAGRAAASGPGLAVHDAAARAQALLRDRVRLVREVQKKQQQLEQLRQRLSSAAQAEATVMVPVVQRQRVLVARLTALFDELLAKGRLPKRARAQVAQLRRALELQGVLDSFDDEPEDEPADAWTRASGSAGSHHARGGPAPAREVAGARQVGQTRRSLRDIFRSLVRAIHPDKAQHEAERAERTEVMKQVTRAYEDGDLARLVELESTWQRERELASADAEQRCRELERTNRELLDQVRDLTRQMRDLKRAARQSALGVAPDELVDQANLELDELEAVCDMLGHLRDGRISAVPPRA